MILLHAFVLVITVGLFFATLSIKPKKETTS